MLRALAVVALALVAALALFGAAAGLSGGGVHRVKDTVVRHLPSAGEPDENEDENERGGDESEPDDDERDSLGAVAHPAQARGDEDGPDEPIDCSVPDNADDSGCDKGDAQDSKGELGDAGDLESDSGADVAVPAGGVQTG